MVDNERHTMVMVNKDGAGAEEWFCPTCGRRFVMHWPPEFKRTILEPGDENVFHVGAVGFAESGPLIHLETGLEVNTDDARLKPFEEFLKKLEP